MANRAQRRAIAREERKAEKHGKMMMTGEVSELGRQWIEYVKKHEIDFNAYFIAQAGWMRLTKNEKINVITELVEQGLVTPDNESKDSTETTFEKESKNVEEQSGEGEGSEADTVSVSSDKDEDGDIDS